MSPTHALLWILLTLPRTSDSRDYGTHCEALSCLAFTSPCTLFWLTPAPPLLPARYPDVGDKLLYSRLCCPLYPATTGRCRYITFARLLPSRGISPPMRLQFIRDCLCPCCACVLVCVLPFTLPLFVGPAYIRHIRLPPRRGTPLAILKHPASPLCPSSSPFRLSPSHCISSVHPLL